MTATDHTIAQALACVAITPGLDSILVFDASPARLCAIEATLRRFLEAATGSKVGAVGIGPTTNDDALWGAYRIDEQGAPAWAPGLVAASDQANVITIRDLASAGLEAQRSLVTLVGAGSVHLERHGQSGSWAPNTVWLAACARSNVGKISPHLLDRFAVRIDAGGSAEAMTANRMHEAMKGKADPGVELVHWITTTALAAVRNRDIAIDDPALDRVLEYFADPVGTTRRTLTLARLAGALARLANAAQVAARHVDEAAALLGLPPPGAAKVPAPGLADAPVPPSPSGAVTPDIAGRYIQPPEDAVQPAGETMVVGAAPVAVVAVPYQEDRAPVEREIRSLVLPAVQQRATVRATRGAAIGVMRTQELRDLAITATVIEAAKHRWTRKSDRIQVTPADLRRHRRVAPVERMLAVVLDYTALEGWDWGAAVLPYLRTAYAQRASICIVQVGINLEPEVRARRSISRSLLAAPIDEILAAQPGSATPLAHGLALALEALRHALQHGRGVAARAQLVVVTDGRGNVPLEASQRGAVIGRVRDEGVRDAIAVAEKLRVLDRLQSVLIQPPPRFATDLPVRLAAAMGAERRAYVAPELDDE